MPRRRHHRQLRDRSIESELKFRVGGPKDHARVRTALKKLGYKLEGTYDEENYRFLGPGKTTRRVTLRLRVLDGGPRGMLTAKGAAKFFAGVKVREETEIEVNNAHATLDLLAQLGFQVLVIYRKHRAVWVAGNVNVTLDRLDFGHFVEVEGPLETIPDIARELGLDPANAVKDSYSIMARKFVAAEKKSAKRPGAPAASMSTA
ncbi:MAG TPA: class IV adenylate cyclase [Candidatus Dormibacteraeota bacterium]|nr:class IV adenylate cyclase [Candidatus Dormibacteraeota bacterium]